MKVTLSFKIADQFAEVLTQNQIPFETEGSLSGGKSLVFDEEYWDAVRSLWKTRKHEFHTYPTYIKSTDGYIGVFYCLDFGGFPIYRFPGGCRNADNHEIANGSDRREDLEDDKN